MERNGVAIAVGLHVLVIGLLSVQWTAGDRRFDNPPMEVDLIAETAATSTAPEISDLPPAARLGEEYSDEIYTPEPLPTPPAPQPTARSDPAPLPKQPAGPTTAPPKNKQPAAHQPQPQPPTKRDRQSALWGTGRQCRVHLDGPRILKEKTH